MRALLAVLVALVGLPALGAAPSDLRLVYTSQVVGEIDPCG